MGNGRSLARRRRPQRRHGGIALVLDAKAGLTAESVEQLKLIGTPNQVEAVMSNLQKRDPAFVD